MYIYIYSFKLYKLAVLLSICFLDGQLGNNKSTAIIHNKEKNITCTIGVFIYTTIYIILI